MSFYLEIPWIPNSSKNRKVIRRDRNSGKRFIGTRSDVEGEMASIAELAQYALKRGSFFDDDELLFKVGIDVPRKRTLVLVESLGPRPKGKTGRVRDCDNVATTIQDALNEVVYRDDSQIRRLICERFPEGIRA